MIPHQTMVTDNGTLTRLVIADNEWMTTEHLRRMARQLNELAIDGDRLHDIAPRHELTPGYLEFPDQLSDHDVYRHAEEKSNG